MENFQVTQGIKQKYGGELHVFCIIMECYIDALLLAIGYDAWIWKKQNKKMEEAHLGLCSAYQSRPKLHDRIKRM